MVRAGGGAWFARQGGSAYVHVRGSVRRAALAPVGGLAEVTERAARSSERRAGGGLSLRTFAAFELRNFRLLWLNNFSYALVQGIQRFAFVWLAADLSEKNLVLGLVTFGLGIPVFFLTLPAGVLSDRWDRRYLLFASQLWVLATSFLTAVLIWTGAMGVGMAIVMAILVGVGVAVGQPVRQALVPAVVPQHRLMNAITLNSLGQNVSQIVGPLLGGAAIDLWGNGGGFAVQGALMGVG
ncbi:MAG: MFS transporter, partial [Dehalococcoidia bacterium]|nr:MFS transporter [Dehalococcoidia bacterium]